MTLGEWIEKRRLARYWKKKGEKSMATVVHCYLRLHSELLEDCVYKEIFDFYRNIFIGYLKKDTLLKRRKYNDKQLEILADGFADILNQGATYRVNDYKPIVEELYRKWKENPSGIKKIYKNPLAE